MKKTIFILFAMSFLNCFSQNELALDSINKIDSINFIHSLQGHWHGSKEITGFEKDVTWYHLYNLQISKDSIYIYSYPISISKNNDTTWSSSDGGFYKYSGIIKNKEAYISFLSCDYCQIMVNIQNPNEAYEPKKHQINCNKNELNLMNIQFRRNKK